MFEESVTIRATEGLQECIDVAHVALMNIVSQQSDSFLVFLHTPPSKFTYVFSIHKVYFIKENVQVQKVLNNWNIVHLDSLELRRAKCSHSIEQVENFWRFFLQFLVRVEMKSGHKLSLYGCLVLSSNVRELAVSFFSRGLGKTAFLQPIGMSLSEAANTVKFVSL